MLLRATPAIAITADTDARLAHLNELYCTIYPGLRYITFVNSRPRSAIVTEMEQLLGLPITPQPIPDGSAATEPRVDAPEIQSRIQSPESKEWKAECARGLSDIWKIGKARLKTLGLE